ncbi:hypothetical protein IAT38_007214 [Cryptococcus sp. DSM 104549]
MITIPPPRPDQIYTSHIPDPPLPKSSSFEYLFPKSGEYKYYPKPRGSKVAFIDGLTGRSVTREEVEQQGLALAGGLKKLGLKKGDVACIFGLNSLEWVNACYGCQAAGVITSSANAGYTPSELLHQLRDSTSQTVFVEPTLLPVLLQTIKLDPAYTLPQERIILLCQKTAKPDNLKQYLCTEDLWDLGKGVDGRMEWVEGDEQRTAYLCYSSGTTGRAKGVETTHHNITSQLQCVAPSIEPITDKDVFLAILPFSHIFGLVKHVHFSVRMGSTVVLLPRFEEIAVLKAIEKYKVTFGVMVPPVILLLLHSANVANYDVTSLRGIQSGAAPLSGDLIEAFHAKFPHAKVVQAYGLTETSPAAMLMHLESAEAYAGFAGRLIPTYEARLVSADEPRRDVELGERGELWLKGPSIMKGYWRNKAATDDAMYEGKWFMTGDVATIDKDGWFMIVDRLKELIKYKGFQVPPAELEALLLTHPDIADVGVIGVYSKKDVTELPRAYIVLKRGLANLSHTEQAKKSKEIQDWVATKVANHKKLRGGVILIDVIPKSPSGKILRKDLKALAVKEEEAGVVNGRKAKL